jgi:hypothetical protein
MIEEYQEEQRKKGAAAKSVLDYAMGIIMLALGIYFLVYQKLGINVFNRDPSNIDYVIGLLCIAYGSWRVYRGYKKNY